MQGSKLMWFTAALTPILWFAAVAAAPPEAEPIVPLGEEVALPLPPTTCPHFAPGVAWFADAGLVAVWDREDSGIVARFASSGQAFGPEVPLSQGDGQPEEPALVTAGDGTFLVAWVRGPFQSNEIVLQHFDRVGLPLSLRSPVTANRYFWGGPVIEVTVDGNVIVAWSEFDTAANLARVGLRLFTADAVPLSGEIIVAETAIGEGDDSVFFRDVALAAGADGGFLITWARYAQFETHEVFARGYNVAGHPVGAAVSLSPPTSSRPPGLAAAALPGAGFLAAWASPAAEGEILVQRLDAAAQPLAGAVRVDSGAGRITAGPTLAVDTPGFIIAWPLQAPEFQINAYGRRLDAEGQPTSGEFGINRPLEETWGQGYNVARIALDAAAGRLAAAWQIWYASPILPSSCDAGVAVAAQTFSTRGLDTIAIPALSSSGRLALAALLLLAGLRIFARQRLANG